ncbi:MAG: signal recognition particle protein [Bacteriovoracaceae bacterium]|jgi:signal recognition particle subunit SRP54|nr:signal recognition particle protein [Bacteriovoracaceae bacterium]
MFDSLSEKFAGAFKNLTGKGKITEDNIDETLKKIRTALLEADVNFKVVKEFVAKVKEKALGEKVIRGVNPGEQFVKIMHDELTSLMGEEHKELNLDKALNTVLIVGLNGAGKTTFTGKLALYLKSKKKKDVYLIPADNFRPAAKDQLIKHAKNMSIDYFDSDLSMLPKDIVAAGMAKAKELGKNVVIVDTAGRLQVDEELMGQLVDVRNLIPDAETLLVADAMTGQEAVNVAKEFHEKVNLTGVVLSKMDSDARGGAALSIRYSTNVPIKFISTGEKMKDLDPFHPDRLAKRILDMGDVVSLVEKAQDVIDEKDAQNMMKRLQKNQFTINDFIKQMDQISKLGSMSSILKMIPGMGGMLRQVGDLSPAEDEMKKMRVIINSMTHKEKEDYKLVNDSRMKRIARGSGTTQQDVKEFIKKFEQMKQMMSGMMGMMNGGGMPNIPGMPQMPGFRQAPKNKSGKKGKKKSPFGNKFF